METNIAKTMISNIENSLLGKGVFLYLLIRLTCIMLFVVVILKIWLRIENSFLTYSNFLSLKNLFVNNTEFFSNWLFLFFLNDSYIILLPILIVTVFSITIKNIPKFTIFFDIGKLSFVQLVIINNISLLCNFTFQIFEFDYRINYTKNFIINILVYIIIFIFIGYIKYTLLDKRNTT